MADGKEYDSNSTASIYANSDLDGNTVFFNELNPDLSLTGYIVFDVTNKLAKSDNLKIKVQTGFWGTETKIINLKVK